MERFPPFASHIWAHFVLWANNNGLLMAQQCEIRTNGCRYFVITTFPVNEFEKFTVTVFRQHALDWHTLSSVFHMTRH
jgi:hypothetical protein